MADQTQLQKLFTSAGFTDYRWIDPAEIVVAQWVRMKCIFGCDSYGRNASCPPNTPSIEKCHEFFKEYRLGTIFHFSQNFPEPEDHLAWTREVNRSLVELERQVSIAGYPKVFLLFIDNCALCRECASARVSCRNKKLARPSAEGMGVDISSTVSKYGYPSVAQNSSGEDQNHYAFLLIE